MLDFYPDRARGFSLHHYVQTSSETHATSYPLNTVSALRKKAVGVCDWPLLYDAEFCTMCSLTPMLPIHIHVVNLDTRAILPSHYIPASENNDCTIINKLLTLYSIEYCSSKVTQAKSLCFVRLWLQIVLISSMCFMNLTQHGFISPLKFKKQGYFINQMLPSWISSVHKSLGK